MIPTLVRIYEERQRLVLGRYVPYRFMLGKRECSKVPGEFEHICHLGKSYRIYRLIHNWDDNTVDLLVRLMADDE